MTDDSKAISFWNKVVDPEGRGLPEAIAGDIASYTGESVEAVLGKMATGTKDLRDLWLSSQIDPSAPESVASFYRDQFIEAYELANWHCGLTNGTPPLSYAYAAIFAQDHGLKRALDFGSGIGTGSLCLNAAGCEVHSADIARQLMSFVSFRIQKRGLTPHMIDLNTSERPKEKYYDIITCFDVLEHVTDQREKLLELQSYLRIGGYLFVNLMNDSSHPDRPMHISSAQNWVSLVRKTGMKPFWPATSGSLQVLTRTRSAMVLNKIAQMIER